MLGCGLSKGRLATSVALGVGGAGNLRLRPLCVPSAAVPSRPFRLLWVSRSSSRPLVPRHVARRALSLSLSIVLLAFEEGRLALVSASLSPLADDEAHTRSLS